MVGTDQDEVEADLLAGRLACPWCRGVLGPWGHGLARTLRRGGEEERVRPRRARCRSCARTHVCLADCWLVRRRDDVETIGRALDAKVAGAGHRSLAKTFRRCESTVRRWLRAFRDRAELIRVHFTRWAYALDSDLAPMVAAGIAMADALEAIGVAARAWAQRYGPAGAWAVASRLSGGALLCNTSGPLLPAPAG
ncbi:MAG: DUF6431 domain-containing protein [Acidimicrobiales bacterium]